MEFMLYFDIRMLPPQTVAQEPDRNTFNKSAQPSQDDVKFEPSLEQLVLFGKHKPHPIRQAT
jgi:hypothetical protein